jgi:hypothetical protein
MSFIIGLVVGGILVSIIGIQNFLIGFLIGITVDLLHSSIFKN